jgi:hypothetical protein
LYDETNAWTGLYPPNGYRLSLSLRDGDGKEFEKTAAGKAISKPMTASIKTQIRRRPEMSTHGAFDFVSPKKPFLYEPAFNLLDCFKVDKSGTNTLTVGTTLYRKSNEGGIYEIVLPSVSIPVPVTQSDLDLYRSLKTLK